MPINKYKIGDRVVALENSLVEHRREVNALHQEVVTLAGKVDSLLDMNTRAEAYIDYLREKSSRARNS
jgi:regulator of replication initiation timing